MEKEIWFDMDGTIADLYGVKGWLNMIINEDETLYRNAKPLVNMQVLARLLNKLANKGYKIGVISWLAKNGTPNYNEKITQAKKEWLQKHLKSVKFNNIDIVKYGTPKQINRNGILFDDEEGNRKNWLGIAHDQKDILETLRCL